MYVDLTGRPAHAAFTAIELLIVISAMALVAGMSVGGVVRSLRAASFNQGVNTVRDAATQARIQAMRCSDPALLHGVAIERDAAGRLHVAVVRRTATGSDERLQERLLSSGVQLWSGASEFGSAGASSTIAWYYTAVTGQPRVLDSDSLSRPGTAIGCPAPILRVTPGGPMLPGADPAFAPTAYASTSPEVPGLSLRTRDQVLREAIAVYADGSFASGGF